MAETNFTNLTTDNKKVWGMDIWKTARNHSLIMGLAGTGINSPIQRITELTKSSKGTEAVITLVPELVNDGAMGDNPIEGFEEEAKAHDQKITIDQIRNANKSEGKMAEQASVVEFRAATKDLLGYWMGDITDQLASLVMTGADFRTNTDGSLRTGWARAAADAPAAMPTTRPTAGYALYDHANRATATAPSTARHFRWDPDTGLEAGDVTAVAATDKPSYEMLVEMRAYAKNRRLKSISGDNGQAVYHVLMHPKAIAKLKLDASFMSNLRNAGERGKGNPLFSGSIETVDGIIIHEFNHVYNTLGASTGTALDTFSTNTTTAAEWEGAFGAKWGVNAAVDGCAIIMLGAQGLAFADIGVAEWDEREHFDYGAKPGIAVGKICGFHKPVFPSPVDALAEEDFGILRVDVAI